MSKTRLPCADQPIVLDEEGEDVRSFDVRPLTPRELVAMANGADALRWHLDVVEISGEQGASLGHLAEALAAAWPELAGASPTKCATSPGATDPSSLANQLEGFTKHRAVLQATEVVADQGLRIFGGVCKVWDHIEGVAPDEQPGHFWFSRRVAVFVVSAQEVERIEVHVDVGDEPPPVTVLGDLPHFADGRAIPVVTGIGSASPSAFIGLGEELGDDRKLSRASVVEETPERL